MELGRRVSAEEIREGSDIYLECHVRANPNIHRLVWIHNVKPQKLTIFHSIQTRLNSTWDRIGLDASWVQFN